ncbi:MAG: phospholipase A [Muribaculaceae bacterium]|nr:phospholipase A [Muribaculaceae bacterium]
MNRLITIVVTALITALSLPAQILVLKDQEKFNADSIRREYDKRPYFSLYKDTYFTVGTTIGNKITKYNSDVKFQVSISQRLTKSVLPFDSYLYLYFTQKAMWNIFEESMPFHDLNFNPGIGIARLIIVKGRLVGKMAITLEHESNGRDGEASRSWNKISLSGAAFIDRNFMVHGKWWIPIVDGANNRDILKYSGLFQAGIQAITNNQRWVFDFTYVKRKNWNPFSGNVQIDVGFRLSRKANQFLMLQYYGGYGECLLDYNKYHSRLRIGLLIRPTFFSDF